MNRSCLAVLAILAAFWLALGAAFVAGFVTGAAASASRSGSNGSPAVSLRQVDDGDSLPSPVHSARTEAPNRYSASPLVGIPAADAVAGDDGASTNSARTPKPSVRATIAGTATWYCAVGRSPCTRGYPAGGMYAAAGPALRVGNWRGSLVIVTSGGRSVAVRLIDACACGGGRVLDLYAAAFARLAPLSAGVIPVIVGTLPAPPETSTR